MTDDLFDDASDSKLGPIFCADFESEDTCCGEGIVPGEDIRADGHGGWIHADTTCERLATAWIEQDGTMRFGAKGQRLAHRTRPRR